MTKVASARATEVSFATIAGDTPSQMNGVCQSIHAKLVNPSTGFSPTFQTGPSPLARFSEYRKVM
jgi:hypothetical protein